MHTRRLSAHKTLARKAILAFFVTVLVASAWVPFGPARSAFAADDGQIRILALGDSLTAGYGLDDPDKAFPAQLESRLKSNGYDVKVLQAGVSGDTTMGGRSRLEWSLADNPDAVIVALGGNDALRAVDPAVTADNIDFIVRRIQDEGMPVLIAGMLAPPNLGRDYSDRFNAIFSDVAKATGALLYPFFLDGVAAEPELNQDDGIHPTAEGIEVIVSRIMPSVEKLIERVKQRRGQQAAAAQK